MTDTYFWALALAVIIGFMLGTLGSGGSIITFPALVYVAHVEPRSAVGMSMAIVGATSLAAAFLHWRRGNFHIKAALLLGLSGMAGAYLGSAFTHAVPPATLMLLFAGLMLVVGILMLVGGLESLNRGRCRPLRCVITGAAVGVLTGFLGVGGGFLIVPALIVFAGLDTRLAVGTSVGIIAINSLSGLAGQLRFAQFDWSLTLLFTALALAGMAWGLAISRRLDDSALRKGFAVLLLLVGFSVAGLNL